MYLFIVKRFLLSKKKLLHKYFLAFASGIEVTITNSLSNQFINDPKENNGLLRDFS